jgi:P pilus assembly chaperone PapD
MMCIHLRGFCPVRRAVVQVAITAVLALAGGPLVGVAAAQVVVEELEVHLRLTGAQDQVGQLIPVKNELDRPQQVRVTIGDWYRDSLGRNVFVDAGSLESTCGDRIQVFPTNFVLAPKSTEFVRVQYSPTASDDGCWSIVFIETVQPPRANPANEGSFLTLELRTGVKIYVHHPNPVRSGAVEAADVDLFWRRVDPQARSDDTTLVREAVVRFANTGTAHYRLKAELEIRDANAQLLHRLPAREFPMTPGAWVDLHLPMPTLAPGDYIAIVLLDFGGDDISAAQIDFRVP